MRSGRSGFTLIELLMVIAIMITLGALLIPTISMAITSSKKAKTSGLIGDVQGAIEMYNSSNMMYPMDGEADAGPVGNNARLREALEEINADNYGPKGALVTNGQIVDAWGAPLRYQHFLHYPVDETHPRYGIRENSFQLWSIGPDGEDDEGQDDDMTNWK